MAVPRAPSARVFAPGSARRPKATPRQHGRSTVGVTSPIGRNGSRFEVKRRRRGGHAVPLAVQPCLPGHFPSLPSKHGIQSPHVDVFQLCGPPILTKSPFDPRFRNGLVARHGGPNGLPSNAARRRGGNHGPLLGAVAPLCPFPGSTRHVVGHVKSRHVGRRAVLNIDIDVPRGNSRPQALLKVPLAVPRGNLNVWIRVRHQRVSSFQPFHQPRDTSP